MGSTFFNLYHQAEDYFFSSLSQERIDFKEKATAYLTGIASEYFNLLVVRKIEPDIFNIIEFCAHLYHKHQLPWCIIIPENLLKEDLENWLSIKSYLLKETSLAMSINLNNLTLPLMKANIIIQNTNDNLQDWSIPLTSAFKATTTDTSQYQSAHEQALMHGHNFYHFTLYEDDSPISSLTLSLHQQNARIDDVGTHILHQRKGYATYLINYALQHAKLHGANYCFLDAAEESITLYKKTFFHSLFKNRMYKLNLL